VATNLNDLFLALGIASWKPVVSALFVSPLPLIAAVLIGAAQMYRRRALAWLRACASSARTMCPRSAC